jgi:hypothetical protein
MKQNLDHPDMSREYLVSSFLLLVTLSLNQNYDG